MTSPNPDRQGSLPGSTQRSTMCIPDHEIFFLSSTSDLPGTNITLHTLFTIVGGVCTGVCVVLTIFNLLTHFIWRRNLQEQKQLMRMILLPSFFTVFSWSSIVVYGLGGYLDPIPKLYEIFVVACFHHLMVQVIHPNEETRTEFWIQTERMNRNAKKNLHDKGSYRWYRVQSMFVHVVLFVILALTIVEEVLVYKECETQEENRGATAAITLITAILTIMAVVSLLRIYLRFKVEYQGTKILRKFWTIKGFVFLYLVQSITISILKSTHALSPTEYMSKGDFEYGLFEFLLCIEGFLFSVLSLWSLSAFQYRSKGSNQYSKPKSDAGVLRYLVTFLFPKEVFVGFWLGLKTLVRLPLCGKRYDYTAGTGVGWKERTGSGAYQPLTPGTAARKEESDDTEYTGA